MVMGVSGLTGAADAILMITEHCRRMNKAGRSVFGGWNEGICWGMGGMEEGGGGLGERR
jgi:hypothetical protein